MFLNKTELAERSNRAQHFSYINPFTKELVEADFEFMTALLKNLHVEDNHVTRLSHMRTGDVQDIPCLGSVKKLVNNKLISDFDPLNLVAFGYLCRFRETSTLIKAGAIVQIPLRESFRLNDDEMLVLHPTEMATYRGLMITSQTHFNRPDLRTTKIPVMMVCNITDKDVYVRCAGMVLAQVMRDESYINLA